MKDKESLIGGAILKFKDRVLDRSYKLTDMEEEIIAFIEENQGDIDHLKISQLAQQFYTVPNTITRLSHKLGYSGFSELKHAIKYEQESSSGVHSDYQQMLTQNFDLIDSDREAKLCDLMQAARRIHFYSIGQTAYVTRIIVDNFYSIDYKSYFYTYPNELEHIINHGENELFFFISLSGEKQQILTLAEKAHDKGHQVFSLTNLTNNTLARLADQRLFCYSPEERIDEYNITDKTPVLLIMNSLFRGYAKKLGKEIEYV